MSTPKAWAQTLVGVGVMAVGAAMAWGATGISGEAGYGGVGPNALPWGVALALLACGAGLVWEARSGGFRHMEEPSGAATADWRAGAWVVAGLVAMGALITTAGFILSAALCFVLAVRGMRLAEGRSGGGLPGLARDAGIGLAISAPVLWLFNKLLGLSLPVLTAGGWI
jgi:putative tricarboxylic transport membrane protein